MHRSAQLPRTLPKFILHFVKKQKASFLVLILFAVSAIVISNTLWPLAVGKIVDSLDKIDNKDAAWHLIAKSLFTALGLWTGMELLQRAKGICFGIVYPRFESNIRTSLFDFVINNPYCYFAQKHTGALSYRIDDLPRSVRLIIDCSLSIFLPLFISILLSTALLADVHILIALIFVLWLFSHVILMYYFCVQSSKRASLQSEARAYLQSNILDSIKNYYNVRSFNRFEYETKRTREAQEIENKLYRKTIFYIERSKLVLSILGIIGVGSLLYITISLWQKNNITTGDIVFMFNTTLSICSALWYAADELNYVFADIGTSKRSIDIIHSGVPEDYTIKLEQSDALPHLNPVKGNITFDKVSFGYIKNQNLFKELSVHIRDKQKIGLVGLSGSGKTTFINLLMRLYDVSSGTISIDGQNISEVSIQSVRDSIAVIQQDPMLFQRTVRENILYGKEDATEEEIIQASKAAYCHEFILKLPEGYQTLIGEGGISLSGGEYQRLAIARAILRGASILVMDEATSSLDTVTEYQVHKALTNLMQSRTTLIIAHRLSTLVGVDRILVFQNGQIIEDGTHKELISSDGMYAKLWDMQQHYPMLDA